jgi:hypothetical protein
MRLRPMLAMFLTCTVGSVLHAQTGYSPPIRVPAPIASRCINSQTDEVTVTLRRVVTQKYTGFFTQENKAGITVLATVNGNSNETPKTPSVNQVGIKEEHKGQVSLALEYPVADLLVLKQGNTVTKNIQLDLFLAKTRGTNTFGDVLDVAGKVLAKLPIPSNPYTGGVNKFLEFANQSIQSQTGPQAAMEFASITLPFTDQDPPANTDINWCLSNGFQATGAIAVFRSSGANGTPLLPVSNLNQQFCFRYTSMYTYELQYVKKTGPDCANIQEGSWQEIPNDYVMLIVSAQKPPSSESKGVDIGDKAAWDHQRLVDRQESNKLCLSMKLPPRECGIR